MLVNGVCEINGSDSTLLTGDLNGPSYVWTQAVILSTTTWEVS